jgi:C1A family cysteine protease
LGWVRDIRDRRDYRFSAPPSTAALPAQIDLRPDSPPILDQGPTNSCVGHAVSSLIHFMRRKVNAQPDFQPSPLFIYWLARHVPRRGWELEDDGAMPRDAIQSCISNGVVEEREWPFDLDAVNTRPPQELLAIGKQFRVAEGKYVRMLANDNLYHLKYSLAQGLPFLIGIDVYTSFFDTGSNGLVPEPSGAWEGGHLMWCNGYNDGIQRFQCPNSWSEQAGNNGIFYLPYDYVAEPSLSGDFWRVEMVS